MVGPSPATPALAARGNRDGDCTVGPALEHARTLGSLRDRNAELRATARYDLVLGRAPRWTPRPL